MNDMILVNEENLVSLPQTLMTDMILVKEKSLVNLPQTLMTDMILVNEESLVHLPQTLMNNKIMGERGELGIPTSDWGEGGSGETAGLSGWMKLKRSLRSFSSCVPHISDRILLTMFTSSPNSSEKASTKISQLSLKMFHLCMINCNHGSHTSVISMFPTISQLFRSSSPSISQPKPFFFV